MAKTITALDRPRYVLYARGHRAPDEHRRIHVVIFEDPSQAKSWLTKFLGQHPFTRDGKFLQFEDADLNVSSDQLDTILAQDDTSWKLPDQYANWILRFKYGSWEEDHTNTVVVVETVKGDGTTEKVVVKKPKTEKPAKEKKKGKPEGYVTAGELAIKWKMEPMKLRAILRGSGIEKPAYGWAFNAADVKKIAKLAGQKA